MTNSKSMTKQVLSLYWGHAKRYPRPLATLLIIGPISTITYRIIPPLIMSNVIRRLSTGDYIQGQFFQSFRTELLLFSAFVITGGIFMYRFNMYTAVKLESQVVRDIMRRMFDHYMALDASFHANNFGGSLVSRTNKLAGSYIRLSDTIVFQVLPMLGSFVSVMIILYPRSPGYVIAFLSFAFVFVFITYFMGKKVRHLASLQAEAENQNTGALADAITNVMAVKAFSAAKREKVLFDGVTEFTRDRTMEVIKATIKRDFAASTITTSMQIMALVVAIMAIVNQDANLALVFLLLNYTAYLTDQLWNFQASTLKNFNRSIGDAYEATVTLGTDSIVRDPKKAEKLSMTSGEIEFKDVVFDHENVTDKSALFNNLNLTVKPGEKIGLVGHSGGGKTTITKLLLRYMDIDGGEITIDGQNIAHVTQDDLRSVVSYVPQEPLLFHRTLAENMSYGKPDASTEEIVKASKMAHAHEFIEKLPKGYDTLVGERGVKLSGGQRQRVAIARAMLKDSPILLLDEATSALDSESEKLIQSALWKLMEGRTAIVIAHRLSTIQRMDRIIVLENGNIVEQGSHQELIKSKGIYSELWNHQSGGFIDE